MATVHASVTNYISPLDESGNVVPGCSPYFQELALVVIAWNEFHLELSQLFCTVAGIQMTTGLRIWHSTDSDRAQRKLLQGTTLGDLQHLPRVKAKGEAFAKRTNDDINFILDRADTISGPRNDAIHSPYLFEINKDKITMRVFDFFMSPRAKALNGKDLLAEFQRQRRTASALSAFAQKIRLALYLTPEPSWPDRPTLPSTNKSASSKNAS